MNCIYSLVILPFLVSICNADTFSENAVDPGAPGLCFYNGEYFPPGEHILPECTRLVCSQKGWASIHSCVESTRKGCRGAVKINLDQPFPECCKKRYTCQRSDGTYYKTISF